MVKLSTSNGNHNIRNITWNEQGLNWTMAARVTYIPFMLAFLANFIYNKKMKTTIDTMCGTTALPVTQKACVPHFRICLQ